MSRESISISVSSSFKGQCHEEVQCILSYEVIIQANYSPLLISSVKEFIIFKMVLSLYKSCLMISLNLLRHETYFGMRHLASGYSSMRHATSCSPRHGTNLVRGTSISRAMLGLNLECVTSCAGKHSVEHWHDGYRLVCA